MDNKTIIDHFKIEAVGHTISFKSDSTISREIRKALLVDCDYLQDIKCYFGSYPTVKTTIYFKGMANIYNFLELGSVRKIFENEINQ